MRGKRMPPPEALNQPRERKPTRSPVTFRLSEADEDALHALAARAQLGASAFARRIVEHYIREHASRSGAKRR